MPVLQYRLSSMVSQGRAEVLARFYSGRQFSQRAKSRIFASVNAWDADKQQMVIPRKITQDSAIISETQHKLDALRDYIFEHWWTEQYNAHEGWLQSTIDCFHGIQLHEHKTIQVVCQERIEEEMLDVRTIAQYNVFLQAIDRFTNGTPLYVDAVTKDTIDKFVAFFRKENSKRGTIIQRSNNTVISKLKRWRAIMRFAKNAGYIHDDPFDSYKIQSEVYGDPICLTIAERDALYQFDALPESIKIQRDIFIFQCHIGCRVSDLISLTNENVDGDFLQYIAHKTRREKPNVIRIPLSNTAKEIIERYKSDTRIELLPFIHPNNYNAAIHDACQLAGLNRSVIVQDPISLQPITKQLFEVVTSHTARRTFAQAMFSETKSERITSSFTGHAENSKAFSRYAIVDDKIKQDAITGMNTIYKN